MFFSKTDLASAGYVSKEDIIDLFGEGLNLPGWIPRDAATTNRINTIIRTNTFEAINEARYSYFTDDKLNGFVQALEYSAILDSRTTQICQHLDGTIHAASSDVWKNYRPPNHYNCRSLLIPVTQIDQWSEDAQPDIEPQQGFK